MPWKMKGDTPFLLCRRVKEAADLHNMSWRVRPEEVLLEVGKTFSSRLGLQKNSEVSARYLQKDS